MKLKPILFLFVGTTLATPHKTPNKNEATGTAAKFTNRQLAFLHVLADHKDTLLLTEQEIETLGRLIETHGGDSQKRQEMDHLAGYLVADVTVKEANLVGMDREV